MGPHSPDTNKRCKMIFIHQWPFRKEIAHQYSNKKNLRREYVLLLITESNFGVISGEKNTAIEKVKKSNRTKKRNYSESGGEGEVRKWKKYVMVNKRSKSKSGKNR